MSIEKEINKLERKIRGKMNGIKNKTITPKESKIGIFFKYLKEKDTVLYNQLINEYKKIMK